MQVTGYNSGLNVCLLDSATLCLAHTLINARLYFKI